MGKKKISGELSRDYVSGIAPPIYGSGEQYTVISDFQSRLDRQRWAIRGVIAPHPMSIIIHIMSIEQDRRVIVLIPVNDL
jgi:hypothetical protein